MVKKEKKKSTILEVLNEQTGIEVMHKIKSKYTNNFVSYIKEDKYKESYANHKNFSNSMIDYVKKLKGINNDEDAYQLAEQAVSEKFGSLNGAYQAISKKQAKTMDILELIRDSASGQEEQIKTTRSIDQVVDANDINAQEMVSEQHVSFLEKMGVKIKDKTKAIKEGIKSYKQNLLQDLQYLNSHQAQYQN